MVGVEQLVDQIEIDPLEGSEGVRAERSSSRAFGTAKLTPIEQLIFDVALSAGSIRTSGSGPSSNLLSPEVRGGVRVRPVPELDFYANAARYVRTPTLGETYGATDSVLGNPALRPEKGPTVEAGYRFDKRFHRDFEVAAEGSGYVRWATDLIAYRQSSFGALRPYNVGSARVVGGELTLAFHRMRGFGVDASLTITDARDTSASAAVQNQPIPFIPTIAGAIGGYLELHQPFGGPGLEALRFGSTFLARTPRTADPAGLVLLPSQLLWDADVSVSLAGGTVVVRGRLSNLLDDRTTDAVGYPLPGRAAHLSLETVLR
jgi:iron complex outermembrane receptor protein